jgi:hypothetical protein
MPPLDSTRPALTAAQVELIRRWIAEGADFREHWAYTPLTQPDVPEVNEPGWVRNPIDAFVARRLDQAG